MPVPTSLKSAGRTMCSPHTHKFNVKVYLHSSREEIRAQILLEFFASALLFSRHCFSARTSPTETYPESLKPPLYFDTCLLPCCYTVHHFTILFFNRDNIPPIHCQTRKTIKRIEPDKQTEKNRKPPIRSLCIPPSKQNKKTMPAIFPSTPIPETHRFVRSRRIHDRGRNSNSQWMK